MEPCFLIVVQQFIDLCVWFSHFYAWPAAAEWSAPVSTLLGIRRRIPTPTQTIREEDLSTGELSASSCSQPKATKDESFSPGWKQAQIKSLRITSLRWTLHPIILQRQDRRARGLKSTTQFLLLRHFTLIIFDTLPHPSQSLQTSPRLLGLCILFSRSSGLPLIYKNIL